MGLGADAVKLYLELWQRNLLTDVESVLDIGSQELHLTRAEFKELVDIAGLPGYEEKTFQDLANWPGLPRCSSRFFYELLGAKQYRCIDLNQEYGAIPHDLNLPFADETLFNKFDLVTDHGANEHVFNIAETYRTMHRLCKPGGIIVIIQALYGGNGYYNFDLSFFEGMAAANAYRILFSSYTVSTLTNSGGSREFHIPVSRDLITVVDWAKVSNLGICYVFQKTEDKEFQFAYQGDYLSQKQGNYGYTLQFLPDPPSRTYVPVRGTGDHLLASVGTINLARYVAKRAVGRVMSRIVRPFR